MATPALATQYARVKELVDANDQVLIFGHKDADGDTLGCSLAFAAAQYWGTRGRRDFTSASQMVAGRYDVLCQPRNAEKARELLAKLAMGSGTPDTPRP